MIHVYPMMSLLGLGQRLQRAASNTATSSAANVWNVLVDVTAKMKRNPDIRQSLPSSMREEL